MTLFPKFHWAKVPIFWLLAIYLTVVFFTGGGSRADTQSLIILRPFAVVFCGIALLSLRWEHLQQYRTIFALAAATFALVIAHLIPMPPDLWHQLPGRDLLMEVDRVSGTEAQWRPIALVPPLAWNAFYALFVPFAVLLLGVQLKSEERYQLLNVILALGLLSGIWGLLQVMSSPDGPLYLYKFTTNGAAVGLFANRNHQAVLLSCLFPTLAVFASFGVRNEQQRTVKKWLALGGGAFLVPLILVTGSRAGIFTGIFGLLLAFVLYRKPSQINETRSSAKQLNPFVIAIGFGALALAAVTIVLSRAEAFRRLLTLDQREELRWQIWEPIAQMAMKYFPVGSGVGSFIQVYQIDEPDALLGLTYVNRAHNDWLEVWVTAGVPGALLLGIAVFCFLKASYLAFTTSPAGAHRASYARLGAVILFIFALASAVDYPLRTPSIACLAVVAMIWLRGEHTRAVEKAGGD